MLNTVGTLIPAKGKCHRYLSDLIKYGDHVKEIEPIPSVPSFMLYDPERTTYRFAYEHLHLILEILGIKSIVDVYRNCGYDIQEPEEEKRLYEMCRSFSDAELAKITEIIMSGALCRKWWEGTDNPSSKIRRIIEVRADGFKRRSASIQCGEFTDEIRRVYKHKFNVVDMDAIPTAAQHLDVSLRWLITIDPSVTVFTDRVAFENFYDAYMLLSAQRRKVIDAMLEGRSQDA